jgi:hypothetical protein
MFMFSLFIGPLLVPYEEARLRNCMQNSARLEQLGIRGVAEYIARASGVSKEKNKTNKRSREDSESDYDPLQDATAEEDLVHDDVAEVITLPSFLGLSWCLFGNAI